MAYKAVMTWKEYCAMHEKELDKIIEENKKREEVKKKNVKD
jgi:hypothetical protein